MLKQLICLLVLVIFFSACTTTTPLTDADVRVVEISIGETQLGSPCFLGVVENIGGKSAKNIVVTITYYDNLGNLLDVVATYPEDLHMLDPGEQASFEVPIYIHAPEVIAGYDTEVTWE